MATISITKEKQSVDTLFQWDTNQILEISGIYTSVIPEIHFAYDSSPIAIVQQATVDITGTILAEIPDFLLEKPNKINVYVCTESGDKFQTLKKFEIPVKSRPKPADYVPDEKEYVYALQDADTEVVALHYGVDPTIEKVYDGEKFILRFGIPIVSKEEVVLDVLDALPAAEGVNY